MRTILAAIWLGLLTSLVAAAEPATNAAYANYFSATTSPDRYLRYLGALTYAERVAHPTRPGRQALQLTVCFETNRPKAQLFWDLSAIAFNRVRFRVWNPNSPKLPIYLSVAISGEKGGYFLPWYRPAPEARSSAGAAARPARAPLSTSTAAAGDRGWIVYEARLPAEIVGVVPKGAARPAAAEWSTLAFKNLSMSFQVESNFPAFGQPLPLMVEGLELYRDSP